MSFDNNGYLGQQINDIAQSNYSQNKVYYDFAYEINKYTHKLKFEIDIHNKDMQELLTGSLLIRILNNYQAIIVLVKMGLETEAKVILRTAIESVIILKLACEDSQFVDDYVNTDIVNQKKLINVILEDNGEVFDKELFKEVATKEKLEDLKSTIKAEKIRAFSMQELSTRAGLKSYYDKIYRYFSDEVHTSPRVLEKSFILDKNHDVIAFDSSPIFKENKQLLITAISIILITLNSLSKLFELKIDKQIKDYEDKLQMLSKESGGNS